MTGPHIKMTVPLVPTLRWTTVRSPLQTHLRRHGTTTGEPVF